MNGKIVSLSDVTDRGITAVLDNGVTVYVRFNPNEIFIRFSNIEKFEDGHFLTIAEIENSKLSNYTTVQYNPHLC